RVVKGFLLLEDGTVFRGESVGAEGYAFGKAVFTTAMTGYQEVVTDPSYADQIVCFTAAMVGNYGVASQRSASGRAHARAAVMREARGPTWTDWLHDQGVVALSGIDTRSLVLHLRQAGGMRGIAMGGGGAVGEALNAGGAQPDMPGRALAAKVSTRDPFLFSDAGWSRIAVVDYGCKRSILNRLAWSGAAVTVYPHDVDADELLEYDGVLLSNGPGDPEPLKDEQATLCNLIGRVPILGICLGQQLLAPPPTQSREETHISLYDGTVEGLELRSERARSVQFHPEAGPGPHDAWEILESWVEEVGGLAKAA